MHTPRRLACLGASLTLAASLAHGAGLSIDGQTSVVRIAGETVQITVSGAPLEPVTLLVDVLPGPSVLFGQTLPLGFSPLLQILPLGATGAGGTLSVPAQIPTLAGLFGQQIFLLAIVHDPAAPAGLDFSNGADLTVAAPPLAGADQGTLVLRKVVLDGSAAATPEGNAKPGTTVAWSLLSVPSGSSATLEDPTRPYATLVPDQPGDYTARLVVLTGTQSYVSTCVVHAWRVDTSPVADGSVFLLPAYSLSGSVVGPPLAGLTFEGQSIAFNPTTGAFGPLPVSVPAGEAGRSLAFRLTHADGTTANHRMTVFQGAPLAFGAPSSRSLAARLGPAGLSQVADVGEETLQAVDLKGILLALPPQQVANETGPFGITLFSATIDFTNLTYNPNIQLQLLPTASGLQGTVTIQNVKADFTVFGEIVEVDYDLDGFITTSPTTITANLVGKSVGGKLQVDVNNVVVNRANFDFELTGFVGTVAELFVIESSVKEQVEATIASTVQAELGPGIEEILNSLVLAGSLQSVLDVDVSLAAPISGVVHDNNGVTIQLDGIATKGVAEPGSPNVTLYRGTPVLPPTFGLLTPGGKTYGAALAAADDFVNQILAAATAAGLLDGDLTSLFPSTGGSVVSLPTDQLALLFPGNGFDHFPAGTGVRLQAHGTVPPVLCLTPLGPSMGVVRMDNLEVEFEVDTAYGAIPMLRVSVSGAGLVDLTADADGTLGLDLQGDTLSLAVVRTFPGANAALMDQQVDFLGQIFNFALPDLIGALGGIPLPSLEAAGLGLTTKESALLQGQGYLGLFGDLLFLP